MVDLSDIPNKKLINEIKTNPDNISYVTEFLNRMETGEVDTDELLMYFELILLNGA